MSYNSKKTINKAFGRGVKCGYYKGLRARKKRYNTKRKYK